MNRRDTKHLMLGLPLLAGILIGVKILCLWAYRAYVFVGMEVPRTVVSSFDQHLLGLVVAIGVCVCATFAVGLSLNLGGWLTKKGTNNEAGADDTGRG